VVIQQNNGMILMIGILMSETCWARKKWNKIARDIKLVFDSSTNKREIMKKITLLKVIFIQIIKKRNKPAGMMGSCSAQGRRAYKHWRRARRRPTSWVQTVFRAHRPNYFKVLILACVLCIICTYRKHILYIVSLRPSVLISI